MSCLFLGRINRGGYFFKYSFNIMKVFELDIPSDRGLTNFDLISCIEKLKVRKYANTQIRKYTNTQIHKYTNT